MPTAATTTVPPPTDAAALMVLWIAVALSVAPSPTAPKAVALKLVAGILGNGGSACAVAPPCATTASTINSFAPPPRDDNIPAINSNVRTAATRFSLWRAILFQEDGSPCNPVKQM